MTYWACPPIHPPMSTYPYAPPGRDVFTLRQIPVCCSLQLRHRPQATLKGTETRSPTLTKSTSRPASITSPVISWPRIKPAGAVVRPRTICWSDPQMLVEMTLRITPCSIGCPVAGSTNFGNSIDSTSTSPRLMYATPRFDAIALLLLFKSLSELPLSSGRFPDNCDAYYSLSQSRRSRTSCADRHALFCRRGPCPGLGALTRRCDLVEI